MMASISGHLHVKRWQVAVSGDKGLPLRKWRHLGEIWDVNSESAAYRVLGRRIVETRPGPPLTATGSDYAGGVIFEFDTGPFVWVGL